MKALDWNAENSKREMQRRWAKGLSFFNFTLAGRKEALLTQLNKDVSSQQSPGQNQHQNYGKLKTGRFFTPLFQLLPTKEMCSMQGKGIVFIPSYTFHSLLSWDTLLSCLCFLFLINGFNYKERDFFSYYEISVLLRFFVPYKKLMFGLCFP